MSKIPENPVYEPTIYQWDKKDPNQGGTAVFDSNGDAVAGYANAGVQQLTNRTAYLKVTLDAHIGSGGTAHAVVTNSSNGFMSSTDKTKLDGITAGAQPNTVTSVAGRTGAVVLTSTDVGLGNVNNTADTAKPVSTAQQTALNLKANLASPALTGIPTAPTATQGNNTTQVATTSYVDTGLATKQATLVSATNIKTINGNTILGSGDLVISSGGGTITSVTATAPVVSSGGTAPVISMPAATVSTNGYFTSTQATTLANAAPLASPALSGTPTAPTAAAGTSTTQLATTAFATTADNLKANIASPTFTGVPAAPTASANSNSTQIATTAYVDSADNLKAPLASPNLTGTPSAPTAVAGTNTTQIATTAFVLANGSAATQNLFFVQDQKSTGTNGGTSVANTYTLRDLNTVVINQISGASLSSAAAEITLPAGSYYLEAIAPVRGGTSGRARVYNKTDSVPLIIGTTGYISSNVFQNNQNVEGYFTFTSTKVIFLQSLVTTGQATNGFGTAVAAFSEVENYSNIRIWKLS